MSEAWMKQRSHKEQAQLEPEVRAGVGHFGSDSMTFREKDGGGLVVGVKTPHGHEEGAFSPEELRRIIQRLEPHAAPNTSVEE
jgi:hypothetical protein